MANKRRQFDLQFKKDAVRYVELHPDISHEQCAMNLNIGRSTLSRWLKEASENGGRGSAALYTYRDTKEKNRQTSCGTQRSGKAVCIQAIPNLDEKHEMQLFSERDALG